MSNERTCRFCASANPVRKLGDCIRCTKTHRFVSPDYTCPLYNSISSELLGEGEREGLLKEIMRIAFEEEYDGD